MDHLCSLVVFFFKTCPFGISRLYAIMEDGSLFRRTMDVST
jgi:hypothetical protein